MGNIVLATVLFFTVLYLDVESDYKKWKLNKPVKHLKEWIFRALFLVPSILLLTLPSVNILNLIIASFMEGSIWWELFDGFYNKIRGFAWRFNGSKDKDDSWLDKLLYNLSPKQQMLLKWGLISIFTTLYILT
jgi:hypothetical protein